MRGAAINCFSFWEIEIGEFAVETFHGGIVSAGAFFFGGVISERLYPAFNSKLRLPGLTISPTVQEIHPLKAPGLVRAAVSTILLGRRPTEVRAPVVETILIDVIDNEGALPHYQTVH